MAEPDVNVIGTLEKVITVGGTGFLFHNVTVNLDLSDLENGEIPVFGRVKLNGHFETVADVERGRRWVFKAHQATRLGE